MVLVSRQIVSNIIKALSSTINVIEADTSAAVATILHSFYIALTHCWFFKFASLIEFGQRKEKYQ